MKLNVMTFNICHGADYPELLKKYPVPLCFGYDKNDDLCARSDFEEILREWRDSVTLDPVANLINRLDCDIIALNEVRGQGEAYYYTNQAEYLAKCTNRHFYFAKSVTFPGEGAYGTALLSRFPIKKAQTTPIPPISEHPGREPRCILKAVVEAEQEVTVFISHFGGLPLEQQMAVEVLRKEMEQVTTPVLFLGDLNAIPESKELQGVYERMGEAFAKENPATFPSFEPSRKIDYIFASKPARFSKAEVIKEIVSDHYPLVAEVLFDTAE